MQETDVIVVGAGPAGSTAAREIAERGARVVLLDRARFPRDKPCGGGITVRTANLLPFSLDPVVEDVITGARLRIRARTEVTRDAGRALTYMTQRCRLDHLLVERAQEAGVDFRDGMGVTRVAKTAHGYEVRAGRNGAGDTYRAPVVIGADGANGVVGRYLGYEAAADAAVALEGNLRFEAGVPDEFRHRVVLNFGYLPGGYAWVFPKGDHVNVGVGGWKSVMSPRLRPALERICRLYGLDSSRLEGLRGHHLPMQRRGMTMAAAGSAVIGDAAGLVDPLSGEGIHAAVASGIAVAAPAVDYLRGEASTLAPYQAAIEREFGDEIEASRALMEIFHAAPTPFAWMLQHSDDTWRRACGLLLGEVRYADVARTFGRIGERALGPTARLARRVNALRYPGR